MPSIRIGFSTDFNLTSEQVGIGTTRPTARLDVRGQVRSDNASGSGGISTLTEYQGFLHSKQGIGNTVSIAQTTKGNLNSLSGELVISSEVTVSAGTSIGAGRLDSLTVTSSFDLPRGGSTNRPVAPEKGNTRFNQDLGQLEFYTGYEWRTVGSIDGSGRGRGVFGGGVADRDLIQYINISTTGNAINFGNLTEGKYGVGAVSSSTRGIWGGGFVAPVITNTLEYVTIASEGNSIDFGDMTVARRFYSTASSSTRGLFIAGTTPSNNNTIDYIQIDTLGNAVDFGDSSLPNFGSFSGIFSSSTRGFFCSYSPNSRVDFIAISSKGNSVSFGDITARGQAGTCANSVRGIIAGGTTLLNVIESLNLSSGGNGQDFGQLTLPGHDETTAASSTRGVFAARTSPSASNVIDYVTIMSAGNAIDFGDLSAAQQAGGGISDSHGGLGGF